MQKHDPSTAQQQVVPDKPDPDAKAVVERAVKALTGGKPELLAKLKTSRVALKGTLVFPIENTNQSLEATRTVAAVWPNRVYGLTEVHPHGNRLGIEVWLHRPNFATANNGQFSPLPNHDLIELNFAYDAVGQIWMPLLLPLADAKAVVFDLQSVVFEARSLHLLKLSLDNYPLYQLTFDAKDALVRVEYATTDTGVPRRTTMAFSDHKPGPDGLVLPHKFECRHNNTVVERWTVEKWEFPEKIGDEQFSPPKKK